MDALPTTLAGSDANVIKAARRLSVAALPGIRAGKQWASQPLRALIEGILGALPRLCLGALQAPADFYQIWTIRWICREEAGMTMCARAGASEHTSKSMILEWFT